MQVELAEHVRPGQYDRTGHRTPLQDQASADCELGCSQRGQCAIHEVQRRRPRLLQTRHASEATTHELDREVDVTRFQVEVAHDAGVGQAQFARQHGAVLALQQNLGENLRPDVRVVSGVVDVSVASEGLEQKRFGHAPVAARVHDLSHVMIASLQSDTEAPECVPPARSGFRCVQYFGDEHDALARFTRSAGRHVLRS
ncbi:hypothetical protein [Lentzea sp. NBRC 105346]|uniref:hypothetical protein n=1 Tax=Lentzea sp. NBRC 105346 TaxID=3032205 RepID=UPI0025532FDD|nr:hypothetical protein [Lentzea sp. NBRC 105346]